MPGAGLAAAQLAAWEKLADDWAWQLEDRVARCCQCGKGIVLLNDSHGSPYWYTHEQWLALVVLHLRSHHADLDPNV